MIPNQFLMPDVFLNMLKTGAQRVIAKENLLNQYNVFPVTDRDTGTNMAALMRFLLAQSYSTTDLPSLLKQIADFTLLGACGNSGMILSAFFVGFSTVENFPNNTFTTKEFTQCIRAGVDNAYQSVSDPVEGTILTVMKAWLTACEQANQESDNFVLLFEKGLAAAQVALKKTQEQLLVLERNGVVDAGALGFFELISGMYDYLIKQEPIQYDTGIVNHSSHDHNHENEPNFQYCAETLLSYSNQNINDIKESLKHLGDSLVINHSPSFLKIHLHTDDILQMTHILKKIGTIQHQKIDSMKSQWEVAHARKNRIAIVVDSSADLPKEWIENEQIHVLPLQVRLGSHTFLDRMTINLETLYQGIHEQNLIASTAAPSPEVISRYLNFLANHYESIIVITISAQLSGTYQIISNLSAKMNNTKIDVIDSHKNSVGHGLLTMLATQYIASGDPHDVIVKKIKDIRKQIHIFVGVNEFKTITKTGRVPNLFGLLASWGSFRPVITTNEIGKPIIAGIAIGNRMSWKKIANLIKKIHSNNQIKFIGIVHSSAHNLAIEFAKFIETSTQIKINFIVETSAVIGLHAGKNCLGIAISSEPMNC